MGGTIHLTSFSLLTAVISLSMFSLFLKVVKTIMGFFFLYLNKWNAKNNCSGTLQFIALEVNPTMMTSCAEKPRNVKKVVVLFVCIFFYNNCINNELK